MKIKRFTIIVLAALTAAGIVFSQTPTVERGTAVDIRLTEKISSDTAIAGGSFAAELDRPLRHNGRVVAAQGNRVVGEFVEAEDSGKIEGVARLVLTLREIEVDGQLYGVETNQIEIRAESDKKGDATVIGGGAGIGALIGAIAGGKKGALIGAAVGAGAGTAVVLTTEGDDVEFDVEQRFRFILKDDFRPRPGTGSPVSELDRGTLDGLLEASGETLERARVLADENFARWAGTYFAVDAFDRAAGALAELSRGHDWEDLEEPARHLQRQYQLADEVVRLAAPDRQLFDSWQIVGRDLKALERTEDRRPDRSDDLGAFEWKGRVEEEVQVVIRGDSIALQGMTGSVSDTSFDLSAALPARTLRLTLVRLDGRGDIWLLEEPSRWNDYRAVVAIDDTERRGSDEYSFRLEWKERD